MRFPWESDEIQGFEPLDRKGWSGAGGKKCLSVWSTKKAEEGRMIEERLVKPKGVKRSRGGAGSREAEPVGTEEKSYEGPWSGWTTSKQVVSNYIFDISLFI